MALHLVLVLVGGYRLLVVDDRRELCQCARGERAEPHGRGSHIREGRGSHIREAPLSLCGELGGAIDECMQRANAHVEQ